MKKKKNQDEKIEFQKPFFRKTPFLRKHFFFILQNKCKIFFFLGFRQKKTCACEKTSG